MCDCNKKTKIVNISSGYNDFIEHMDDIDFKDWLLLKQCRDCRQLWIVDEWDKYQSLYATKVQSEINWKESDRDSLIKEQIIINHGGLADDSCMWAGCKNRQVKGSAFCIEHMYEQGIRA